MGFHPTPRPAFEKAGAKLLSKRSYIEFFEEELKINIGKYNTRDNKKVPSAVTDVTPSPQGRRLKSGNEDYKISGRLKR